MRFGGFVLNNSIQSKKCDRCQQGKWWLQVIILLAFGIPETSYATNPWSKVNEPTRGLAEAIGTYDLGCLRGAQSLPPAGAGYYTMRLFRHRFYGHPNVLQYVQTLGQRAMRGQWGTLLVGDLSQPRGGPAETGHKSHQTGLDVDIWYQTLEDYTGSGASRTELDSRDPGSVVLAGRLHPSLWKLNYGYILAAAAQLPEVDRIFVNPVIKRAMCTGMFGKGAWLGKLRPWWRHDDHFHVRLKCPTGSRHCIAQPSPPPGDGCDGSLDWWFSEAVKLPTPGPTPMPRLLPAACERVLSE